MTKRFFAAAVAAAALSVGASAAAQPAPASDLNVLDPAAAQGWADRLVQCDLTQFVQSAPDLHADIIYAWRDSRVPEMLLPPYYVVGGRFYDEDLERAYRRLKSAGLVTHAEVAAAQDRYTRPTVERYGRNRGGMRSELRAQARYCSGVADEALQVARR
jgi:opacity protein-like surface antigen